jgi:hypothetical protein
MALDFSSIGRQMYLRSVTEAIVMQSRDGMVMLTHCYFMLLGMH